MWLLALAGCPLPEKPADSPEVGEEDVPTLAGCTVTMEAARTDGTETTLEVTTYDADGLPVAAHWDLESETYSNVVEQELGWDGDLCLTDSWFRMTLVAEDGATWMQEETAESTCDEHANPVWQKVVSVYEQSGYGRNEDTLTYEITNSYDGEDRLVREVWASDDGTTRRTDHVWTDASRTEYQYDGVDADAYTWMWWVEWNADGDWTRQAYLTADGDGYDLAYHLDDLGRVGSETWEDVEHDETVAVEVTSYTFADRTWLWPETHALDEGDDGSVDETATYSYDCR